MAQLGCCRVPGGPPQGPELSDLLDTPQSHKRSSTEVVGPLLGVGLREYQFVPGGS